MKESTQAKIHHGTIGATDVGSATVLTAALIGATVAWADNSSGAILFEKSTHAALKAAIGAAIGGVPCAGLHGAAELTHDWSQKCKHAIPAKAQKTWQISGAGLMIAFSVACGIGGGMVTNKFFPQKENAPANTNTFNIKADKDAECIIVVSKQIASTLSGPCEVKRAP